MDNLVPMLIEIKKNQGRRTTFKSLMLTGMGIYEILKISAIEPSVKFLKISAMKLHGVIFYARLPRLAVSASGHWCLHQLAASFASLARPRKKSK